MTELPDFDELSIDAPDAPADVLDPTQPPASAAASTTDSAATVTVGGGEWQVPADTWTPLGENAGQFQVIDVDADGGVDLMLFDADYDGVPEAAVERTPEGGYLVYEDTDLDGNLETTTPYAEAEFAEAHPELYTAFQSIEVVDGGADGSTEPVDETQQYPEIDEGRIIGDPYAYGDEWIDQQQNGFCLPAALTQIYTEYTGEEAGVADFVELANQHGAWQVGPDGVPGIVPESAEEMLESVGIPAEHLTDQTINDLAGYLSDPPHAVMVSVDADVYWSGEPADGINHVVLLTGIDPVNGVVYLSDTGTPDGNMMEVDIDVFLEAWGAGGNEMIVAETPAEEFQASQAPADDGSQDDDATSKPATDEPTEVEGAGGDPYSLSGEDAAGFEVPDAESDIDRVAGWVGEHPWVLLPVTLGVEALISDSKS